ncbi:ABC transporter ATP-binding protein [soil metagenome]
MSTEPGAGGGLVIDELRVRYPGRAQAALDGVSAVVGPGEVVGVAGRTGAGKSTLALAAGGFIPRVVRAKVEGGVQVGGWDALRATLADLAGTVGIVFSSPALQLSSSKPNVREELAFGLENLGVPRAEMDARIDVVLARLRIGHLAAREPLALSGGEQQRVAIASILVMGTRLIVLDEPTAQLDPGGTADVAALLGELAADGRAVFVAEHASEVLAVVARCLVLDAGRAVALERPGSALRSSTLGPIGLRPPTLVALAELAGVAANRSFDELAIVDRLRARMSSRLPARDETLHADIGVPHVREAPVETIEVRGLVHRYPGGVEALRGVDLSVRHGDTVAIVGQNGSGKTTLVKHFNGLLRADEGSVRVGETDVANLRVSDLAARIGFVFQNPDDQLFHGRVDQEVAFGPRNLGLPPDQVAALVEAALSSCGLAEERATNPYDLGLSIRKLVALASVLAMEPPILVLDEPTTGQDGPGTDRIGAIIDAWAVAGRTVVAITHDMEFAARHFGRVVVMRQGKILLDGPPAEVLGNDRADVLESTGLAPPPAARIGAALGLGSTPTEAALIAAIASSADRR